MSATPGAGTGPRKNIGAPAGRTADSRTFISGREDGRFVHSAAFLHKYLQTLTPKLAFRLNTTRKEFPKWRKAVRAKLLELMCFPDPAPQPAPQQVWSQPRDGYRIERWEAFPEPHSVVPFYLLVPDGVSPQSPGPAVMCFPGTNRSKECLAGEPELGTTSIPDDAKWLDNRMAYYYVRRGIVAVAMDNPGFNELASPIADHSTFSLHAIWAGRSAEAISVFQKDCVLQWLVRQPFVDARRIAMSGHSLGAKPADILAVLYPDLVKAVVHNDFVCHWQERAVAISLAPMSVFQIVPGIFQWFDYTDLEASLAPRPLLFTEGGRPNQIAKIRYAYELLGAPEAMQLFHYGKYSDPASRRLDDADLPMGMTMEQYFEYAYVDAPDHRFRHNHAVPWLAGVFGI